MRTFIAEEAHELVKDLPREPGVYLLKDDVGRTLYVGKSSNIRSRVRNHLSAAKGTTPTAKVHGVEYILTGSELEALVLEANLIKRLRPRHNARLKDDKSYPYIKVTVNEEYPGIHVTRQVTDDGSTYMGPYADVKSARRTVRILREIFPVRGCRRKMGKATRPCLDYHIGRCSGPCTGKVDRSGYVRDVGGLISALKGNLGAISTELKEEMLSASRERNYERAAVLRDRVRALERTVLHQRLSSSGPGDGDILGLSVLESLACVQILFMREGVLIDHENLVMEAADAPQGEILSSFVKEFYSDNPLPSRILVPAGFDDLEMTESWFRERVGRVVRILQPKDRDMKSLVTMAERNAEMVLRVELRAMGETLKKGLQDLARGLDLPYLPKIIEAYDISNTAGRGPVGSMVRFRWGKPNRSLYRKFRIRTAEGRDDYAMMGEVLHRRFAGAVHQESKLPDLVLVDGGRGQASVARDALRDLGLHVPVVGLAKGEETIYLPERVRAVRLRKGSPGHLLLRGIRDEAHRFAISYHRSLRRKEMTRSELDSIRGIGPTRKAELLRRFGSIEKLARADPGEVAAVRGIGDRLGRKILESLRGRRRARVD